MNNLRQGSETDADIFRRFTEWADVISITAAVLLILALIHAWPW